METIPYKATFLAAYDHLREQTATDKYLKQTQVDPSVVVTLWFVWVCGHRVPVSVQENYPSVKLFPVQTQTRERETGPNERTASDPLPRTLAFFTAH